MPGGSYTGDRGADHILPAVLMRCGRSSRGGDTPQGVVLPPRLDEKTISRLSPVQVRPSIVRPSKVRRFGFWPGSANTYRSVAEKLMARANASCLPSGENAG